MALTAAEGLPATPRTEQGRSVTALLCLLAAFLLGHTLQLSNGTRHPQALSGLTGALLLVVLATALPHLPRVEPLARRALLPCASLAFLHQAWALTQQLPGSYLRLQSYAQLSPLYAGLAAAALLVGAGLGERSWLGRARVPALLAVHFALGVWLLHASPNPHIDVFVFQRDATQALLSGLNPYAMTFPDIYGGNSPFYGPGLSVGGRLQFGFPYPPLSLLLALPGQVLAGDPRYAQLVALTLTGGLLAYLQPGRLGAAVAALYLFTPRGLFVLEQGWTEPFVVLGLAAVVFCAARFPRALPYALGLFLASKQYLVLVLPLVLLLLSRPYRLREAWALLWRAAATGLAVSLPLVLWDVEAFWHSVAALQVHQPFRMDSLSYLAWWRSLGHPASGAGLAFALVLPGLGLALWRAPRSGTGFALGAALVLCLFFAFNKQAFANYYFFVLGALCVVAAAAGKLPFQAEGAAPARAAGASSAAAEARRRESSSTKATSGVDSASM